MIDVDAECLKGFYIVVGRVKLSRVANRRRCSQRNDVMKRVCFVLQVKPERIQEYKERHRAVWPEMQRALRETGWNNYSLFLRQDGLLVGYLETESFERARASMAVREVNKRWQHEMAAFFVQPEGLLPDEAMAPLEEVFHV
jgi:L-rhamnose mutarotase